MELNYQNRLSRYKIKSRLIIKNFMLEILTRNYFVCISDFNHNIRIAAVKIYLYVIFITYTYKLIYF